MEGHDIAHHTVPCLQTVPVVQLIFERVTGRIGCKSCGRPYHKKFDPPLDPTRCDQCSGPLIQRDDDREEIIRKRLEVYRAQTEPLIAHYSKQNDVFRNIDSGQEKGQVYRSVLANFLLSGTLA